MAHARVVDVYPLTPVQEGMLFHALEGTNVGVDIEQFVGSLQEDVAPELLRTAWQRIAERHPILRTRFQWTGRAEPVQEVLDHVEVPFLVEDLRDLTIDAQEDRISTFLRDDRRAGFDLDVAPLWRLALFLLGPARQRFVFTYHHSLLDTSVVWVTEEAWRTYDSLVVGETVELEERRPFRDHVEWLRAHLDTDRAAAQHYYGELLAGFDAPTRLWSLDGAEPISAGENAYGALRFDLPEDVSQRFHSFAGAIGVGGAAIVEATWGLVLAAFSGTPDVVFGSTRGCRRSGLTGSENVMGLFINTPPVRLTIDPTTTVVDLVRAVRSQQVANRAHEHTALSDIQAVSETRPAALFETIVVVNDLHQGTRLRSLGGPFASREFDLDDQTNFPLTLLAYLDPQIGFKLSYDRSRFSAPAIERARELFTAVLSAMVEDPPRLVSSLPRAPERELQTMREWNAATEAPYPSDATVHGLFEAQVDRTPDSVALVHRSTSMTYRELDGRANAVAAHLRQLGVEPDSTVGLFVDRSIEMVVGLLGILKAGGAYVPMDPAYPAVRIGMMLEDSKAEVVLTQSRLAHSLPGVRHVVCLDTFLCGDATRTEVLGLHSDQLAYVIFTSGSTGRPKGVMVEHRNVVNFFTAMDEQLEFTPGVTPPGRWLAVTSISFDISVLELLWTLTRGFTLVVQDDETRLSTDGTTAAPAHSTKKIDFSLFYFASDARGEQRDRYRLLLEGAKFADTHGFTAVWTPERHFHEFGGLYPNPALTSAAVAVATENIQIRAGSVVLPLHNPISVAEDWSVIDNLSNGRVGLSFASGWHADDFVLAPENFENRRELMAEGIETIRALWRGESVGATSGNGREIAVSMFPPPVQAEPPIWVTAGGTPATFEAAGRTGASILTNLLVMSHEELVVNIEVYRTAYREAGHPGDGHITLMLHTFVGSDDAEVRALVREPFLDYLRTSTNLINRAQWETTSFARSGQEQSADHSLPDLDDLDPDEIDAIMDHAFNRYVGTYGLFGTPESCVAQIRRLQEFGVDEVACLIDFGVDQELVLEHLQHLDELRVLANRSPATDTVEPPTLDVDGMVDTGFVAQVERHHVTHVQCTPSMAATIAADRSGLAALASLEQLMLGGEALPPALVDHVRPEMAGRLLNMYGPTETTIWSTVSTVESDAPITIGHPIANTQVYIVDRDLQLNPLGTPGELLIGGAGVVRGYLDRPELTAERFVELPAAGGARVYRTGDLVTLQEDGVLQFGGRLDHQVKIRGYRIELGEIEAAIGRLTSVRESVVVARTDGPGEARLVAYVVADDDPGTAAWGELWDETYAAGAAQDPTFDIAGWNDSYSGAPIPVEQMREWVDGTVDAILSHSPRQVLEIGCGTGLLLFRIAPSSDRYVGVDLSRHALDGIAAALPEHGLGNVELHQGDASQVASLTSGPFDAVIVNSVTQYFADADYLVDVIGSALDLLEPGGTLFLGDVRSRAAQPLFDAAVELAKASASTTATEVAARVAHRSENDDELVVDPGLFHALAARRSDVDHVEVALKPGRSENEMTRFRYDVVVQKTGAAPVPPTEPAVLPLDRWDPDAVRGALADTPPVLCVTGLRNARLVREAELLDHLRTSAGPNATVAELRTAMTEVAAGDEPGALPGLDLLPSGYTAVPTWSAAGIDRFDVVLRTANARLAPPVTDPSLSWSAFTNRPTRRDAAPMAPQLRNHLRTILPDHMVPSAFVILDALPRTPNGKIDRASLPSPDRSRMEGAELVAAEGDLETVIATIWQDLLALDVVSVESNLFDLGANSLMMVRANSRISEELGRKVSLVDLFAHPTIRLLARHLDSATSDGEGSDQLNQSMDRGEARRAALRRRPSRTGGRR